MDSLNPTLRLSVLNTASWQFLGCSFSGVRAEPGRELMTSLNNGMVNDCCVHVTPECPDEVGRLWMAPGSSTCSGAC